MKISRIRIEQFKQFRQAIDIRDLEPGLNLFTGPNEAGKSTIVQAIRAAFLEKHRSGSVEDLRPWGESTASPTVELEFTLSGQPYRLAKSFLARKRCELQVGSRHLEGSDAEEHLAGLLGFQHADRGASKAEHWGIPGLLWIQQGSAQDIHDPVAHATDHLRHALNQSLGEVTSSGGEVLARVESRRNELLTAATGKPRGPYAEALEKVTALATALQQQDVEIATYRQSVDRLAALRREHAADEAEKPWEGFREQEKRVTEQLASIRRVEENLRNERQRGSQLDQRIVLLHSQLETFAGQEQAQHTRAAAVEAARQAEAGAAALVEQWTARHAEADTRLETMRTTLRLARQEDTRRNLTRQLEDLRQKTKTAAETLARAEAEHARLLELQRQAAASEILSADLKRLREQHQQLRELEIRQATAATRLQFELDTDCRIQLGGESVAGHGERLLLKATPLVLPGLGRLEITPGGADLAQLHHEASEIADRQAALLQRLGLPTLEAAEARHLAHTQHLAEINAATATLKALTPKGLEALRTELATQQARTGEVEQALSQLPAALEHPVDLPSITEAETAEQAAAQSLASVQDSLHAAQLAAGKARTILETAQRELQAAQALLNAPERTERVAATQRDLVDARAEQATVQSRITELDQQVAQARPEILQQDVERFRRSAEQHEKHFNDRRDVLMRLEVELQTAGAQGLEERRAELARDLAQAERRVEELENRAKALDHLLKLLQEKRRALTRRLQAPLQKHLNRHLQLLFPQATLDIDEDLSPGPLMRTGASGIESGEFEALSFGAREQMGVISRLAYADLLREAGRPTLVILDDALVHSDEERLAQMKRVLFDAATRHQILLFSCHPGNWRDLGVRARSLEEVRAGD